MTADMSVIGLLLKASMPVQIVMLLLIGASVVSWSIIFTKRRLLRRTTEASDEFEAAFWSGGDLNTLFAALLLLRRHFGAIHALITDDHLEVEERIEELQPELVLGTQMERHISKRLGMPCAVISAPVHVQDFPARYAPQMGFEGANVIFDTWVHPLMMGLEEHLLQMFREDFEFNDDVTPSHLAAVHPTAHVASEADARPPERAALGTRVREETISHPAENDDAPSWEQAAEKELKRIPFFVRGKARRNTEIFAAERGVHQIGIDTLYEAKAHYAR